MARTTTNAADPMVDAMERYAATGSMFPPAIRVLPMVRATPSDDINPRTGKRWTRATRERRAARARAIGERAAADKREELGPVECQRRIRAYIDAARAAGRQIGSVTIDGAGNAYEWLSWERMMSE